MSVSDKLPFCKLEKGSDAEKANVKSIARNVAAECDNGRLETSCDDSTKILIVRKCASIVTIVNDLGFFRNINRSQIFILVVKLNGLFDAENLTKLCDKVAKPIILQIENCGSSQFFFTTKEKKLQKVEIDDTNNLWSKEQDFDFNEVCNLLYSNPEKFGNFGWDLMEMKIDTNACFNGKRLIDLAVKSGDLLALKFLMLFQPDIEAFNDQKEKILEIVIENGNMEFLKVLLEIPAQTDDFEDYLSLEKRRALNLMTKNDLSLLMLAAQSGNIDIIRFLLQCGLNVHLLNNKDQTACDIAWNNGHFDAVAELIKADSPFPYDFDNSAIDSELLKMSDEHDLLHEQIRKNQIDDLKAFVVQNLAVRCAYDTVNQCALVTALESKNFEIYSFLRSKGFITGIDGDLEQKLSELTSTEKDALKLSNRKYFPPNENSHIMDLLSRSRLGFESDQKNFEKVQKYFEALDAIPEVQPILQIISSAKKLDIVFDFNRASVADLDPTQDSQYTVVKGRTIYDNGTILIGGKSSEVEVLATMAHEFTHYAMHLLYDNQGHPYHATDQENREEFTEIVKFCEVTQSKNPVIENVFTYPKEEHALELIVRVPHLLALHCKDRDTILQFCQDYQNLMAFFSGKVLPECEREIPVMKAKHRIHDLNKILDVKRKAEASKLFCGIDSVEFGEIMTSSENILIRSPTPNLVLCNLLNFTKAGKRNTDSAHIFIKLEQLMDSKNGEMILEAFDSFANPKLFVLEAKEAIEFANIKTFYNYPTMHTKVVSIFKSVLVKKSDEENFQKVFPVQRQIKYTWKELDEISKTAFLSSKLQFQGLEISLGEVLPANSKILNDLALEEAFNLFDMKLRTFNESVPPSPQIYLTRTFVNSSNQTADLLATKNVIELLTREKFLILADDSGMGKTISALHISRKLKQQNPLSWVVYIDLKLYTDHYYKDEDTPTDVTTSDFFGKILNLESRVEKKFFEHFYENGKVMFIVDGFDEISPTYSKCILEVGKTIQQSKNRLIVTTRTNLAAFLEKNLNSKIIKHLPFTIDDQVEFLKKFWSLSRGRPVQDFETKARSILENFRESMTKEDFFAVPLQVRMLAEIYEKTNPTEEEIKELNIYTLYRSFMRKKTDIWVDRGPLAKEDNTTMQAESPFNILQIHEKLAIENFFEEDVTEPLMLPEIEETLTDELLVRIGLVQAVGSGKFQFSHQSFSEYLVAEFILSNITKKVLLAKSDELHQMFLETLDSEKFEKVRSFMNGKLEIKEKRDLQILSLKLEKSIVEESKRKFLLNVLKENLSAVVNFMLMSVAISKACKVILLNQENEHGDKAIHIAGKFSNESTFNKFWNCVESFSDKRELIKYMFCPGFSNKNVLIHAIANDNMPVSVVVVNLASSLMDNETFKHFLWLKNAAQSHALIIAAKGHPTAFSKIWKAAQSKIQAEDLKNLMFWQNLQQQNVLLAAVYLRCSHGVKSCDVVIQTIMNILVTEKLFEYEDMRKFLFAVDQFSNTVLHIPANIYNLETFTTVWRFIKSVLNESDQKTFWKKKYQENIFLRSVWLASHEKTILKHVISAAKEILSHEELREALTEKNARNLSIVSFVKEHDIVDQIFDPEDFWWVEEAHKADQLAVELGHNNEPNQILEDLRDALKAELSAEKFKFLIYKKLEDGNTALHFALELGTILLNDRIFELADMTLNRAERLELIRTRSNSGKTILSRTYLYGFDSACLFLVRQSDLVSDVKPLFVTPDCNGMDFFGYAALIRRRCLIDALKWFKKNFCLTELRKHCSIDLAHSVVHNCHEELVVEFLEFCVSSFTKLELKEMLLTRLYDGENLLEKSLYNERRAVPAVWFFYEKVLPAADLEDLLFRNSSAKLYFEFKPIMIRDAILTLKVIVTVRYGEEKAKKLFKVCSCVKQHLERVASLLPKVEPIEFIEPHERANLSTHVTRPFLNNLPPKGLSKKLGKILFFSMFFYVFITVSRFLTDKLN